MRPERTIVRDTTRDTAKFLLKFVHVRLRSQINKKPCKKYTCKGLKFKAIFRCRTVMYGGVCLCSNCSLAERVGFEPTNDRSSPVFKTGAFNHSAISPQSRDRILAENLSKHQIRPKKLLSLRVDLLNNAVSHLGGGCCRGFRFIRMKAL